MRAVKKRHARPKREKDSASLPVYGTLARGQLWRVHLDNPSVSIPPYLQHALSPDAQIQRYGFGHICLESLREIGFHDATFGGFIAFT